MHAGSEKMAKTLASAAFSASLVHTVLPATISVSPGANTLLTAINSASPHDTVSLPAGVYDVDKTVVIDKPIWVRGAGSGTIVRLAGKKLPLSIRITNLGAAVSGVSIEDVDSKQTCSFANEGLQNTTLDLSSSNVDASNTLNVLGKLGRWRENQKVSTVMVSKCSLGGEPPRRAQQPRAGVQSAIIDAYLTISTSCTAQIGFRIASSRLNECSQPPNASPDTPVRNFDVQVLFTDVASSFSSVETKPPQNTTLQPSLSATTSMSVLTTTAGALGMSPTSSVPPSLLGTSSMSANGTLLSTSASGSSPSKTAADPSSTVPGSQPAAAIAPAVSTHQSSTHTTTTPAPVAQTIVAQSTTHTTHVSVATTAHHQVGSVSIAQPSSSLSFSPSSTVSILSSPSVLAETHNSASETHQSPSTSSSISFSFPTPAPPTPTNTNTPNTLSSISQPTTPATVQSQAPSIISNKQRRSASAQTSTNPPSPLPNGNSTTNTGGTGATSLPSKTAASSTTATTIGSPSSVSSLSTLSSFSASSAPTAPPSVLTQSTTANTTTTHASIAIVTSTTTAHTSAAAVSGTGNTSQGSTAEGVLGIWNDTVHDRLALVTFQTNGTGLNISAFNVYMTTSNATTNPTTTVGVNLTLPYPFIVTPNAQGQMMIGEGSNASNPPTAWHLHKPCNHLKPDSICHQMPFFDVGECNIQGNYTFLTVPVFCQGPQCPPTRITAVNVTLKLLRARVCSVESSITPSFSIATDPTYSEMKKTGPLHVGDDTYWAFPVKSSDPTVNFTNARVVGVSREVPDGNCTVYPDPMGELPNFVQNFTWGGNNSKERSLHVTIPMTIELACGVPEKFQTTPKFTFTIQVDYVDNYGGRRRSAPLSRSPGSLHLPNLSGGGVRSRRSLYFTYNVPAGYPDGVTYTIFDVEPYFGPQEGHSSTSQQVENATMDNWADANQTSVYLPSHQGEDAIPIIMAVLIFMLVAALFLIGWLWIRLLLLGNGVVPLREISFETSTKITVVSNVRDSAQLSVASSTAKSSPPSNGVLPAQRVVSSIELAEIPSCHSRQNTTSAGGSA